MPKKKPPMETPSASLPLADFTAATKLNGVEYELEFKAPAPTTLEEAIAAYGEAVVFSFFERAYVVNVQGKARDYIKQGSTTPEGQEPKTMDEIYEFVRAQMLTYNPTTRATRQDALVARIGKMLEGKTPQEIEALQELFAIKARELAGS